MASCVRMSSFFCGLQSLSSLHLSAALAMASRVQNAAAWSEYLAHASVDIVAGLTKCDVHAVITLPLILLVPPLTFMKWVLNRHPFYQVPTLVSSQCDLPTGRSMGLLCGACQRNHRLALKHVRGWGEHDETATYETLALPPQYLFLCTERAECGRERCLG